MVGYFTCITQGSINRDEEIVQTMPGSDVSMIKLLYLSIARNVNFNTDNNVMENQY